jgi:DNA recombination protein RmuC
MTEAFYIGVGLVLGLVVGWLWASRGEREARVAAETRLAEIEKQREQERSVVEEARAQLGDTFKALSSEALRENTQAFVERATQTMEPLQEALRRYDGYLRESHGSLNDQVKSLRQSEEELRSETRDLVGALRRPGVRGRWGELTFERVVEIAGMSEHLDFEKQRTIGGEGGQLRPDYLVNLPNGRVLVVDVKISCEAYLEALKAEGEEAQQECLRRHSRQLRERMNDLARKSYWDQLEKQGVSPEFVIMFVPGESFLHAACAVDSGLIEEGLEKRVLVTSPISLLGVLRVIERGWREHKITEGAQEVGRLGRELYDRMRRYLEHVREVGSHLDRATAAFNAAVGSLRTRVLPSLGRFRELGAGTGEEIPELEPIDSRPREVAPPEPPEDEC